MQPLRLFFCFLCLSVFVACKKDVTGGIDIPTPETPTGQPVKRDHGQPTGAAVTKAIGAAGGTIQSADGRLTVTVPAGAVEATTNFSIQPVTNTLETRGPAYRLLPEGIAFKKDLTVAYSYAGIRLTNADSKYLFLAYQDAAGYYHEAKGVQNNNATQTLSVQTKHFSDWTFFCRVELGVNRLLHNGVAHLKKNETMALNVHSYRTKRGANDVGDTAATLFEEFAFNPSVTKATWSLSKPKGTLTNNPLLTGADYTAPFAIPQQEELMVTVTLDGYFGTDNFDNPIKQLILSQPMLLLPDDEEYFEVSVNGAQQKLEALTFDYSPGWISLGGYEPTGNAVVIHAFGAGLGSYAYGMPGTPGKANMDYLIPGGIGFTSSRPKDCTGTSGETVFSTGAVNLTKIAAQVGEYNEGTVNAQLFYIDWCGNGQTKNISGRFKIKKR